MKGNIQKNGNCGFKQTTLADAPDKAPAEDYRMQHYKHVAAPAPTSNPDSYSAPEKKKESLKSII
jgi:hypothetical protein